MEPPTKETRTVEDQAKHPQNVDKPQGLDTQGTTNEVHVQAPTVAVAASSFTASTYSKNITNEQIMEAIEKLSNQVWELQRDNTKLLFANMRHMMSCSTTPTKDFEKNEDTDEGPSDVVTQKQTDLKGKKVMEDATFTETIIIEDNMRDEEVGSTRGGLKGSFYAGTGKKSVTTARDLQKEATDEGAGQLATKRRVLRTGKEIAPDVVKKLSFSPTLPKTSKGTSTTEPVVESGSNPKKRALSTTTTTESKGKHLVRKMGVVLPKKARSAFEVTCFMNIHDVHRKLCAYVFDLDSENWDDPIFQVGRNIGTRRDFQCLCPGRVITNKVVLFTALRQTCAHANTSHNSVWYLPPGFAEGSIMGASTERLKNLYGNSWTTPFPELDLVYVPVQECTHWYLVVLSFSKRRVYHMDSYVPAGKLRSRKHDIELIIHCLCCLMEAVYEEAKVIPKDLTFTTWDVVEPRTVPGCCDSKNSGVWVVQWMRMGHMFTDNVPNVMDDSVVRLDVTSILLLGPHNVMRKEVAEKAELHWRTIQD